MSEEDPVSKERKRRQSSRNWAIFLILIGFIVLVYATTITRIKMGMSQ